MINRGLVILLMAVFASWLAACDGDSTRDGPDDILEDYLLAKYLGQNKIAYIYVSSADKSVKTLKDYLQENRHKINPLAKIFVDSFSVRILSLDESETGTEASVETLIRQPDVDGMLNEVREAAAGAGGKTVNIKQAGKSLAMKYEDDNVPVVHRREMYQLVKEYGNWKVHLDWQTEIIEKDREVRISAMLAEARDLRKSSNTLEAAISKYNAILALDDTNIVAKQGIVDTGREISEFEAKKEYIDNVLLYDLESMFFTLYSNATVPGVKFKLKNNGDRLLREVEVTVYFKDANGMTIAEERYYPVLSMKKSYRGDQVILKENYIWQMEEGNFYKADSLPTEWEEGSVTAQVTNVKFAE